MTLNLRLPASASLVLGLPVCATTRLASDSECVCASRVRTLGSLLAQRQLEEEGERPGSLIAHDSSGV